MRGRGRAAWFSIKSRAMQWGSRFFPSSFSSSPSGTCTHTHCLAQCLLPSPHPDSHHSSTHSSSAPSSPNSSKQKSLNLSLSLSFFLSSPNHFSPLRSFLHLSRSSTPASPCLIKSPVQIFSNMNMIKHYANRLLLPTLLYLSLFLSLTHPSLKHTHTVTRKTDGCTNSSVVTAQPFAPTFLQPTRQHVSHDYKMRLSVYARVKK